MNRSCPRGQNTSDTGAFRGETVSEAKEKDRTKDLLFLLKGLNCAACAAAIEGSASRIGWVKKAAVDPVTSMLTITVDADLSEKEVASAIQSLADRIEPGVKVYRASMADSPFLNPVRQRALAAFSSRILPGLVLWASAAVLPTGQELRIALFIAAYLASGWNVLGRALKNVLSGRFFDEYFLMSIATIGAISIGEFPEAVAVMLFFRTGLILEESAVERARGSISSLVEIIPDKANLINPQGQISQVRSRDLAEGDLILIRPGERVPVDGSVLEGLSSLDTSSITGESLPRDVAPGDPVLAGFLNRQGSLKVEVSRPLESSAASRILAAIGDARSRKTRTERLATSLARVYTPSVVALAVIIALLPPLSGWGGFEMWLYRALVFLVASCPCALLISIPLGVFAGIGAASGKGILIKGGDVLEKLSKVRTVFLDKTGTVTTGRFHLAGVFPSEGFSEGSLLELAVTAERNSNHPLAETVRSGWGHRPLPELPISTIERPGLGIEAETARNKILAGNRRFMLENGIEARDPKSPGTVIHVAENGRYAGYLVVADTVKEEASKAVSELRAFGVDRILLLSGDLEGPTTDVANRLSLDGAFWGLLPEEKVALVEEEQGAGPERKINIFAGDGLNDAPVIARADVGISMGKVGSDITVDNADVVIMNDSLLGLPEVLRIARKTRAVIWQNILLALGVKAAVLILGAFGVASLWEAVFADVGVTLLAVINSSRILRWSRKQKAAA
ncbi:MAG TPA: cadmium-translocating P-type ATPase [Synergistaceae bacterium]|nr:cadmium-translocating P-type ATPase [Synergistaceae bacterium]HCP07067.1 cadmium-translocating P-type ATPase [Synergistaceae bacterium]HCR38277.1 cadmium-translocating P-type ATPase [Synergistaceae bacterium]